MDATPTELGTVTQPHTSEYYERILNPEKKLPQVELYQFQKSATLPAKGTLTVNRFQILDPKARKTIGELSLDISSPADKKRSATLGNISLRSTYIGKGYGKATYLELLKHLGETKLLSGEINEKSRKIWEWLKERGMAKLVNPYIKNSGYEII